MHDPSRRMHDHGKLARDLKPPLWVKAIQVRILIFRDEPNGWVNRMAGLAVEQTEVVVSLCRRIEFDLKPRPSPRQALGVGLREVGEVIGSELLAADRRRPGENQNGENQELHGWPRGRIPG